MSDETVDEVLLMTGQMAIRSVRQIDALEQENRDFIEHTKSLEHNLELTEQRERVLNLILDDMDVENADLLEHIRSLESALVDSKYEDAVED